MGYQTQREKIKEFIDGLLIPALEKQDLDYYMIVNEIVTRVGCSKTMAEEGIDTLILSSGRFKEIRLITLDDKFVQEWADEYVKDKKEEEKVKEEEVKKANNVIERIEEEVKESGE